MCVFFFSSIYFSFFTTSSSSFSSLYLYTFYTHIHTQKKNNIVSPLLALTGLKVQSWSPWSPHHQLYHRPQTPLEQHHQQQLQQALLLNNNNNNNPPSSNRWKTPILPIRRASMAAASLRKDVENCISHLEKRRKKPKQQRRDSNISSQSMDTMSIQSNPF